MENDLMKTMKSISNITEELIEIVENGDYSKLEKSLDERQQKIDLLKSLSFSKEEYKKNMKEFNIELLHKKLFNIINEKESKIKEKMYDLSKNKMLNNSYNHDNLAGAKIFSKKI
jgi:hypothetical protein